MSILNRDQRIIENLFRLAQDIDPVKSSRLSACLVYKNNIIGYGFSQMKSHPFQAEFAKNEDAIYLHAETDCIKNALRRVSHEEIAKSTLYIARAKRDNKNCYWMYGLAKPCPGCARAIATFGIEKVVYTLDGKDYKYM
jgi:deoxycytidylate deaminase